MYNILSLFSVLHPHLSMTSLRQFSRVVFALLAMTGRVSMLNISRWTSEGGSYRTIQRFFNTVIPWGTVYWVFFSTYLLDPESTYILAGDETTVSKSGTSTYGLSRFFSSVSGKTIPSLAFLSLSLVSVKERRSYPMVMEQIVRGDAASNQTELSADPCDAIGSCVGKRQRGRPKGSRNRNKVEVKLSDTLKHIQMMLTALLARIGDLIPLRYFVLDGYFGHNNALQMTKACGLHLISKVRVNTALYFPSTEPYAGRGRPRLYGQRFNPQQIDPKYRVSIQTHENIRTQVYQATLRHKKFPETLNVVCILKTHLPTEKKSHVLLFSSDLALDAEKIIDYYSLRFQIEFNFRDAKQFYGLDDFMNVNKTPVNNAANLSMFMVNVSAKLLAPLRLEHPEASVLDLKAHYRGLKYLRETLKILPQKPEPIVIDQIAERLGSIGAIHHTPAQLNTS
uniref:Putative transposase n=1 Tax=uncultured Poribacteria bacterium 64K2 TaxID=309182 RepID=Q24M58_9BACT|nr:putative transposase [uncultured Poribacteria bacterium 64K2]